MNAGLLHPQATDRALDEVEKERGRQDQKWGEQDHTAAVPELDNNTASILTEAERAEVEP